MTSLLLFLSLFSRTPYASIADSTPLRSIVYVVKINKNTSDVFKGYLQHINDTSLRLILYPQPYGYTSFGKVVTYHNINNLSVYRKGWAARGAGWGGVFGAAVGALVGIATYKPCTNFCIIDFGVGPSMIGGAILGTLQGAAFGLGIGSRKRRFKISRKKENFGQMRSKLLQVYGNREDIERE